jgi:hypothetical protein
MSEVATRLSAIAALVLAIGVVVAVLASAAPSGGSTTPTIRPLPQNFFGP